MQQRVSNAAPQRHRRRPLWLSKKVFQANREVWVDTLNQTRFPRRLLADSLINACVGIFIDLITKLGNYNKRALDRLAGADGRCLEQVLRMLHVFLTKYRSTRNISAQQKPAGACGAVGQNTCTRPPARRCGPGRRRSWTFMDKSGRIWFDGTTI